MLELFEAMVFEVFAAGEVSDALVQAAGEARYAAILGEVR